MTLADALYHFKVARELVEVSSMILECHWIEHINIKDTQSDNKKLQYIHLRPSSNIFFFETATIMIAHKLHLEAENWLEIKSE